jgi:hypothetical protein
MHFGGSLECQLVVASSREFVGVLYPRNRGPPITTQNSRYDRFPPTTNGWGIIHPVLDMAPPLLAEEEGPPT